MGEGQHCKTISQHSDAVQGLREWMDSYIENYASKDSDAKRHEKGIKLRRSWKVVCSAIPPVSCWFLVLLDWKPRLLYMNRVALAPRGSIAKTLPVQMHFGNAHTALEIRYSFH